MTTPALLRDAELLIGFARDASGLELVPEALARPGSAGEVTELLVAATRDRIAVTPAGGQTSTTGASITDRGILLSLRGLGRVLDVDRANGTARADMTYRADPDPRTDHNIYKGEIKDGVISVTEPGHLFMVQEPLLFPRFTLDKFHARMKMNDQGVMEIIIGGYQPISEIYHWCGSGSIDADTNFCAEPPGAFHTLSWS